MRNVSTEIEEAIAEYETRRMKTPAHIILSTEAELNLRHQVKAHMTAVTRFENMQFPHPVSAYSGIPITVLDVDGHLVLVG